MSDAPSQAQEAASSRDVPALMRDANPGDDPISTELRTSERVLARVTDGIYRRPGSALRELISNAYDADATHVAINTDRPRFQRVTVSDDGLGMSPEVVAHLVHNIGGSAKRTNTGKLLGVTSLVDDTRSPGGRLLIGKIGIGLFSVAQLTQSFQISTKVKGDRFSSVASVVLRQYSDSTAEVAEDGTYKAGSVIFWKEPADDTELHGTTITLTSVRPQTKEVLQSTDIWEKVRAAAAGQGRVLKPPLFNIGLLAASEESHAVLIEQPKLPWDFHASPGEAFESFVDAPNAALSSRRNPLYEEIFDEYLQMLWRLGLSAPLPYPGRHPFDISGGEGAQVFIATGRAGDEATPIELDEPEATVRSEVPFPLPTNTTGFGVSVDEVAIKRPILLGPPPPTQAALQTPILFVGHYRSEFKNRKLDFSGGPLEFSAYLYWTPKLVPADHRGVLIRVNEASGTLFDPDFLGFPVNEERRLGQITCEIFISEGFDGALNIDRESFNHSHPHVTTLTRWFHGALRQLIATQKRLGSLAAGSRRKAGARSAQAAIQKIVDEAWATRGDGGDAPDVLVVDVPSTPGIRRNSDAIVLPSSILGSVTGPNSNARLRQREELVEALTKILDAYELFDDLSDSDQVELIKSLFDVAMVYVK